MILSNGSEQKINSSPELEENDDVGESSRETYSKRKIVEGRITEMEEEIEEARTVRIFQLSNLMVIFLMLFLIAQFIS